MAIPHYINENQSAMRSIKPGWYAIEHDGNLPSGPFLSQEECFRRASQPTNGSTPSESRHKIKSGTPEEDRPTEDDIARKNLGPRGVPDAPDTAKMTLQEDENIPRSGKFDGHTA